MLLRRCALAAARQSSVRARIATRTFASTVVRCEAAKDDPKIGQPSKNLQPLSEIKTEADLLPPGAAPGTVPTDLEQATGLERLEILGKMQGVDVFDMKPLDASRRSTLEDPIIVRSFGEEQYLGCTGYPADSHWVLWLTVSKDRPVNRCGECGQVYKMEYVGKEEEHGHDDHGHGDHHEVGYTKYGIHKKSLNDPVTLVDFLKPEYKRGM